MHERGGKEPAERRSDPVNPIDRLATLWDGVPYLRSRSTPAPALQSVSMVRSVAKEAIVSDERWEVTAVGVSHFPQHLFLLTLSFWTSFSSSF